MLRYDRLIGLWPLCLLTRTQMHTTGITMISVNINCRIFNLLLHLDLFRHFVWNRYIETGQRKKIHIKTHKKAYKHKIKTALMATTPIQNLQILTHHSEFVIENRLLLGVQLENRLLLGVRLKNRCVSASLEATSDSKCDRTVEKSVNHQNSIVGAARTFREPINVFRAVNR